MILKTIDDKYIVTHSSLFNSKIINNVIEYSGVKDDDIELPVIYTYEDMYILVDMLSENDIDIAINKKTFEELNKLCVITNYFDIPCYKHILNKIVKKIRLKSPEQILDMYNMNGENRYFLLNNTDFITDCDSIFN